MVFGAYGIVVWLVLVVVITRAAIARGRNGTKYFLVTLLLSPVVGYMALTAFPDQVHTESRRAQQQQSLKGGLNI